MLNNKKASFKGKLVSLAVIAIIALFLLEMGLRIGGYVILKLNPPLRVSRSAEHKDAFVILCLGDSFTFGVGTDYQHSYPRQLEVMLNEKFSKGAFKIYNLGIPGSNSSQLVNNLQCNINEYNPDLLIIMTGRNDIWNFTDAEYLSLLIRVDSLLSHSRLYKAARILAVNLAGRAAKRRPESVDAGAEPALKRKIVPEASRQIIAGHDFGAQGRYDLAKECFLKALELDPGNPDANRQLGTIYREEGMYELAEQCLKQAVAEGQDYPDKSVYMELGMVHRLQKKYELTKEEFKQAMMDLRCAPLAFNELWQLYPDSKDFYRERANLKKINEFCKKNKVRLVFQTYPSIESIAGNIRKAAKQDCVPLVDNYLVFQKILITRDKKEFFVADDHCDAKGYRIVAENIYETLINQRMLDDAVNAASAD